MLIKLITQNKNDENFVIIEIIIFNRKLSFVKVNFLVNEIK